jgi:hypothetical protein
MGKRSDGYWKRWYKLHREERLLYRRTHQGDIFFQRRIWSLRERHPGQKIATVAEIKLGNYILNFLGA